MSRMQTRRSFSSRPTGRSTTASASIAFGGLIVVGVAGIAALIVSHPHIEVVPRHVAILLDRSDSMEDGTGSSCTPLRGIAAYAFNMLDVTPKSHIQAYLTGERNGAQIAALGGGDIAKPQGQGPEAAFLNDVLQTIPLDAAEQGCRAEITKATTSPLYASITAAIQHMQGAWGCGKLLPTGEMQRCTLIIRSDLVETEAGPIKSAIAAPKKLREGLVSKLTPMPHEGIDVVLCGTGESMKGVTQEERDGAKVVWSKVLPDATWDSMSL